MATFVVHFTVDDRDAPGVSQGFGAPAVVGGAGRTIEDLQDAIVQYVGELRRGVQVELIYDPTKDPHSTAYVQPVAEAR